MAHIPHSGEHHLGVPLFEQSAECLSRARRHLDCVAAMRDVDALAGVVMNTRWAAEARLYALALLKAQWAQAAEAGRIRPNVDLRDIESHVAHLNSSWADLQEDWPPDPTLEPEDA